MKFNFKEAFAKISIALTGEEPTMAEMESATVKINEVVSNNEKLTADLQAEKDAHDVTKQSLTTAQADLTTAKNRVAELEKLPGATAVSVTATPVQATQQNEHPDANESWFNTPWNEALRKKAAAFAKAKKEEA